MTTTTLVKTSCISVALAFMSLLTTAQLTANFTATPVSGCAPLIVSFSDQSTGNPTQWKWDLGNGTISFLKNPSVTYFSPGKYTVKLVVQNASGKDSITKSQFIDVFQLPTVNFTSTAVQGCAPFPVQFTDASAPGSGTIAQWQWDFGDGTGSTLQNPSHVYQSSGNYNVSLKLINSNGCINTITKSQLIKVGGAVTASFTHIVAQSCNLPVNVTFTNTSTGPGILTYLWSFGDGTTTTIKDPIHSYNSYGSFPVSLIVTSESGCADTFSLTTPIQVNPVTASISMPDTVCVNSPVTFQNTSTPAPATSQWNFGDGTTSTIKNPVKTYTTPGTYTVTLTTNPAGCNSTTTKTIVITPKPVSAFTATPLVSCAAPMNVQFTNTSTGANQFIWNFGDGNTSNSHSPLHIYQTPGTYTVRLISISNGGCADTLTRTNYIKLALPTVSINNLPQEGCAPFSWNFSATVTANQPIASYLWDFGDGTTSTVVNPSHTFDSGTFNIKLKITTIDGCTDSTVRIAGIRAGIKPVANFSATPRVACAVTPIQFTDLSTGNPDRWLWDFGDGTTSAAQNPSHIYGDTGFYTIRLITWNNGCADTIRFTNYIQILAPIADFLTAFNCTTPDVRSFTDESIGADTWSWNFGDGNTSNLQNPVHTYAAQGFYTVSLTVTNIITGCSFTTSEEIRVILEKAEFSVDQQVLCRNTPATFTSSASAANIASYQWTFGDGGVGTGKTVSHTYVNAGIYAVQLIITDKLGCKDTLTRNAYITVNGPTANFGVGATGSCSLSNVPLYDSSKTDGTHAITSWTWNYGDGITETLASGPFGHTYVTPGVFTIKLTVTDNAGCSDTKTLTNLLTISKPKAIFKSNDTITCPNLPVTFINTSTGPALSYVWNLGDGNTSSDANPTHTYTTTGFFTVKLFITDQYGCTDSLVKENYIDVSRPVASFTTSDTLGTCPPLIVNFTNTSTDFTSLSWDFGDGTSSTATNPSHFYAMPGTYIATLTAKGRSTCTSTKQQKIVVLGPQGSFSYTPLSGCDPLTVSFKASTLNRVSFIWDFADGNIVNSTDSIITHTYTIPGNYIPRMILIDAGGCVVPVSGPDTIKVYGVNASFTANELTLCDQGNVQFNNTSVYNGTIQSYHWKFGDGSTSSEKDPLHFYSTPGTYYPELTVTLTNGCTNIFKSIIPVKIVASPQPAIQQTASGCTPVTINFSAMLQVADTSAITWQWNFGNGNSSSSATPTQQVYSTAGDYTVTLVAMNSSGCKDTATTIVSAYPIPDVQAGNDVLSCIGTGKKLQASGASTYQWSPSTGLNNATIAAPVANPDSATTYFVTGTNTYGCSSTDSVRVAVKYPFEMRNSVGDTLCAGGSTRLIASGAHTYVWSPSTGLNSSTAASPVATPSVTTNYRVVGFDDAGCFTDTAYIPVKVFPVPTVEAGNDITINVGEMADLVPVVSSDVTEVTWSPTGSVFRSDYPSITVRPRETTTYTVEVSNAGGCRTRDNITVNVLCNNANVFIPNTFSPNGDGSNDIFYPRGTGLFKIKSMRIFNRWGEMVFEKNNFNANDVTYGWDGTYKGAKLSSDVFVYMIEIVCDNNTALPYKGNVALVR